MYLTSFIHRKDFFNITERWLCGHLEPDDGLRITQILICDGFVLGETLDTMTNLLLGMIYEGPFQNEYIHSKGELRDAICRSVQDITPRVNELIHHYKSNPDFFYKEAPVNGVICLGKKRHFLGFKRVLVLFILMMMVFIGFQCGKNANAPDYLIGVWRTSHEKYADRFFEIKRNSITFDIGKGKFTTHRIINVEIEKTQKEKGTLYTIYYKHEEGEKLKFSFYYDPANQGQIRFKNQDQIVWTKERK